MSPRWGLMVVLCAAAGACATLEWEPLAPRRIASVQGAEPVGATECGVCHEDVKGHELIASYHAE